MADYVYGPMRVRTMEHMAVGKVIETHDHNFDHLSYVPHGAALFEAMEGDTDVVRRSEIKRASDGHNYFHVKAGVRHRFTALEDNTHIHCIFPHRNYKGEIVEKYEGWAPAYE